MPGLTLGLGLGFQRRKAGGGAPVPQPLQIAGTPVLTATQGAAYAGFTVTAFGGTPPYTYSLVGTWPAGISINPATGVVSGTPTETGSFAGLSVRVTDANSDTADLPAFTVTAVTGSILDGLSPSGAWSVGRSLLSSYSGSLYAATGGAVSRLYDQSGTGVAGSKDFTDLGAAAVRPLLSSAGPNGRPCADFDGVEQTLRTAASTSSFLTATDAFMVVTVMMDALKTNDSVGYRNDVILGDLSRNICITAHTRGGGAFLANNFAGGTTVRRKNSPNPVGEVHVLALRHQGGVLYCSIDGGPEGAVSSGNTPSLSGPLCLSGSNGFFADCKIFEAAVFSSIPNAAQRTALVADFMNYAGAARGAPTGVFDAYADTNLTGAWSFARDLIGSNGGPRYTTVAAAVDRLRDQSGWGNDLTDTGSAAIRPGLTTVNGHVAGQFNGTSQYLSMFQGSVSEVITTPEGYICVALVIDEITRNLGNRFDNHAIIADTGGYMGLYAKNTGTPKTAIAFNYDGGSKGAESAALTPGNACVLEWRHAGGRIYLRVDGGAEVDGGVAGNTSSLNSALSLMRGYGSSPTYTRGKVLEAVAYKADPGLAARNAIMSSMKTLIGI